MAGAPDGSVYIAPSGYAQDPSIRHLSATGALLDSWPPRDLNGSSPSALAIAPDGSVYVAVTKSYSVVYHFTAEGHLIGRPWSTSGQVSPDAFDVSGIALDAAGDLYVADRGYNRIVVFFPAGKALFTTGSTGVGPGHFKGVSALAVAPDGTV